MSDFSHQGSDYEPGQEKTKYKAPTEDGVA